MTRSVGSAVTHAVVLAGGRGTRIQKVLADTPKALALVGGRPFLHWKLMELEQNGIESVTLLLGWRAHAIREFLMAESTSLNVETRVDGQQPLGTGGALADALQNLPAQFFLTYGDSLLDMSYANVVQIQARSEGQCVLAVTRHVGPSDKPNCRVIGNRVVLHDKVGNHRMNATDYGLMLLDRSAVASAVDTLKPPFDLSVILGRLAKAGMLDAAVTEQKYWEIGTPDSLKRVDLEVWNRIRRKDLADSVGDVFRN